MANKNFSVSPNNYARKAYNSDNRASSSGRKTPVGKSKGSVAKYVLIFLGYCVVVVGLMALLSMAL
jgi:hypothetical protein